MCEQERENLCIRGRGSVPVEVETISVSHIVMYFVHIFRRLAITEFYLLYDANFAKFKMASDNCV